VMVDALVENRPVAPNAAPPQVDWRSVSPGYLEAMGIPLLAGRTFTTSDALGGPEVTVVDDSLAASFWPGESALGKRLELDTGNGTGRWWTVVGVVKNVRATGLDADAGKEVYTPFDQAPRPLLCFALHTRGDPLQLVSSARQAVRLVDRDLPVERIQTMGEIVDKSIAGRRSYALLLAVFAGVALALVAVGIYGVMSYSVVRRVPEIGIRMALGARREEVLTLVVGQGMALAGLGVAVGLPMALASSRLVASLLYGVSATDALTFAAVTLVVLALALVSCYMPARRATRVDPIVALRAE
jgi:putative ABC transport system permease protein